MKIYTNITQLIGGTPLLELCNLEKKYALEARILAKLEYFNPLGSVKDRAACAMLDAGLRQGKIGAGTVIIEPTSGNTGVGLAFICATRGYRLILTMPESMSAERRTLLSALGAEVELTPGSQGMQGAVDRAHQLCKELPDAFMPMQFDNPANPAIHQETTSREIWEDAEGAVDILVAGFGSGGTLTGTGRGLKERNPAIQVVGVEPSTSAVASGGNPGPHRIQGIGAGFVPKNLDREIMDEIITVSSDEAYEATRELALAEGLLVGISSGAAFHAACKLALRRSNKGKNIVAILPDTGERYLSTGVFNYSN